MPDSASRRMLAVLAHPDDESFGPGGTLAFYARQGVQVHLACATRGEVGDAPPELLAGYASLGDRREAELRCAAGHLGLASVRFLGYRDSGMPGAPENRHPDALASAPLDQVVGRVVAAVRELRPQVVITSDPLGGYGHPDHIAIHQATVRAFRAAADPSLYPDGLAPFRPQKLYFHTFPRRMLRALVRVLALLGRDPSRWGRNRDVDLTAIAAADLPIHARIDVRSVAEAKTQASACHASQGGGGGGRLTVWMFRLLGGRETFMRGFPPGAPGLREHDLFAGIAPDAELVEGARTAVEG